MSTSAIQHIVVMPVDIHEGRETPFQLFSLGLRPDYLAIVSALVHFPHDMLEFGLEGAELVRSRMAGTDLNIRMIRIDLLDEDHCELRRFPTVIWSTAQVMIEVEANLKKFEFKPLHLTLGELDGAVSISSLTPETIRMHLLALAERAADVDEGFKELFKVLSSLSLASRNEGQLSFAPGMHNSTKPLADVLAMYGYQFKNAQRLPPVADNLSHIKSMVEMAEVIDSLRKAQPEEMHALRKNDAIIFCPSILAHMYRLDHWNHVLRDLPRHKRNFVKSFLLRNSSYSNGQMEMVGPLFNPYEDPVVGPMLMLRQFELRYFTTLVSVVAANQFVPAFRLPNSVMLHHDMLSDIYSLVNSSKKNRVGELNKRLRAYGSAILGEIGPDLLNAAFKDRERLLLICDFPIEWLPIDLVPAMFRYEISRIPSTPGNLTGQVMVTGPRLVLPCKGFSKILVIRSFGATDPIRKHLEKAIEGFPLKNVIVEFVDVSTVSELIEVMNHFDGALLVFDCHGNHGGKTEHAWLVIGKERVDVWQLANVARIPPIIILAACSTHPMDGSHASVANGFLRSGALSVIGTYASVDSVHTAIFVARLLYRIEAFVPLLAKHRPCTWREIVSGFFRMSYATDVLRDLHQTRNLLTQEQYVEIHMKANTDINAGDVDWLVGLQQGVMAATGMNEVQMREFWSKNYQFVETMLFTQLGRPEMITIISDEVYFRRSDTDGEPAEIVESVEVAMHATQAGEIHSP